MDETTKCEGCGTEVQAGETFYDVMENPRCVVCLPGLDDDEFLDYNED